MSARGAALRGLLLAGALAACGGDPPAPSGGGAPGAQDDADQPAGPDPSGHGAPADAADLGPGADGWYADFDPALRAARSKGFDLLVDFTGSDWCAPCAKLDAEVFDTPEFEAATQERYVRVRLDFPRGPAALERVLDPARNEELRVAHAVTDMPEVLLVDPELADGDGAGGVYGRFGYLPGGPAPTLAAMEAARAHRDRVRAVLEEPLARRSGEALRLLEAEPDPPLAATLGPLVEPLALGEDAEMASRALAALTRVVVLDEACMARVVELDPRNAEGLYLAAVRSLLAGARGPDAVERAVGWAEHLAEAAGGPEGAAAAEVWSRAAGWAHTVLRDRVRARWFASLALQAGGLPDGTRLRMESIARGQ